jgi:hypothetical protein
MRGLSSTPAPTDQLNLCDSSYPVPPDPQPPVSPRALFVPPAPTRPSSTSAPPKPRGPSLHVSVRRDRKHSRYKITVRCSTQCRFNAYLMTRKRHRHRFKTQSTARTRSFSSKTRHLSLRIPAHTASLQGRARVVVQGFDRSGDTTRVTRSVRLH